MDNFPQMFMVGGLHAVMPKKQENVVQNKMSEADLKQFEILKDRSKQIKDQFKRVNFIAFRLHTEDTQLNTDMTRTWSNLLGVPITSCTPESCTDYEGNTWAVKDGLLYKEETLGK